MGKFVAWNILLILVINSWWLSFTHDTNWAALALPGTVGIVISVLIWIFECWEK